MDFNTFIFPAPKPSYDETSFENMVWIPRSRYFSLKKFIEPLRTKTFAESYEEIHTPRGNQTKPGSSFMDLISKTPGQTYIPCLYQPYSQGSDIVLVYFHGNAEDIGIATELTCKLSEGLKMNVLSVEYPGYGVYKGTPTAKGILEDAEIVFDFLTYEMMIDPKKIFLMGRSIGTGPATYLASSRESGLLILLSAYTSIKEVAGARFGSLAKLMVAERFRNVDEIEKVTSPCFFLHGSKDTLIPSSHTHELFKKCKAVSGMSIGEAMTHNYFDIKKDILRPIVNFLKTLDFKHKAETINFPKYTSTEVVFKGKLKLKESKTPTLKEEKEQYLALSPHSFSAGVAYHGMITARAKAVKWDW